jgi:PAS fold
LRGIVRSILDTGDPVTGIEVAGQRADQTEERFWITDWHSLCSPSGEIVGINVAAEEITERKTCGGGATGQCARDTQRQGRGRGGVAEIRRRPKTP